MENITPTRSKGSKLDAADWIQVNIIGPNTISRPGGLYATYPILRRLHRHHRRIAINTRGLKHDSDVLLQIYEAESVWAGEEDADW